MFSTILLFVPSFDNNLYDTKIITSTHFTLGVRYFIVVLCLLIVYPFSSALSKLESIFNYRISVRTYYYFSTATATKPNDLRSSPSSWPFMSNATEWSTPLNFDLSLNQFKSTEWSLNYFHLVPRHPCSCWGFEEAATSGIFTITSESIFFFHLLPNFCFFLQRCFFSTTILLNKVNLASLDTRSLQNFLELFRTT